MTNKSIILPEHVDRGHSVLGASSCYRWWNCLGSIRMNKGKINKVGSAAKEGTAAHQIADYCLRNSEKSSVFIGFVVEVEGEKFTIDEEFSDNVQVYLDECNKTVSQCGSAKIFVEEPIDLQSLGPPIPMFSTLDFAVYDSDTKILYVKDLKYGFVNVEAEGNLQLKYYALGASLSIGEEIDQVEICIVQPRGFDGVKIKKQVFNASELKVFSEELMRKAWATQEPDAPLVSGDHCKYCLSAGSCPAQAMEALSLACHFDCEEEPVIDTKALGIRKIENLTTEDLVNIYNKRELLIDFLKVVEEKLKNKCELFDEEVPFKLVANQSRRHWRFDDLATSFAIKKETSLKDKDLYEEPKIKSPAQIEKTYDKLLKDKGNKKNERDRLVDSLLSSLTDKKSTGTIMVPLEDKRDDVRENINVFETETDESLFDWYEGT